MKTAALLLLAGACGRVNFSTARDGGDGHGSAADGSGVTVLADFSSAVPYNPDDFIDDDGSHVSNAPTAVTAVIAPYDPGFAVTCGRAVVMVGLDGTTVVHDYRPAVAGGAGPDELGSIAAGALPGSGADLWLGAESQLDGDGVYVVDPTFAIARDNGNNNVNGLAIDATGAFDATAVPTLYFASGNLGVLRRTSMTSQDIIMSSSRTLGSLGVTAAGIYAIDFDDVDGSIRLDYIASTTHAVSFVDGVPVPVVFAADDAAVGSAGILALRDPQHLTVYQPDGTFADVASPAAAAAIWVAASVPRAPHPLAGRRVVVEFTPSTGRERLLLLP